MFTGIIQDMGTVRKLTRKGGDALLEVTTALPLDDVKIGDSIAVSGACLTATALGAQSFTFDVSAETLSKTTLGRLKAGDRVNLEKALR
jgi:riboflavin synthase